MPESVPCPRCRQAAPWHDNPYRPFCSSRCKVVDAGAWASDEYRIPGEAVPPDPDDSDNA